MRGRRINNQLQRHGRARSIIRTAHLRPSRRARDDNSLCHCEERSDVAIHTAVARDPVTDGTDTSDLGIAPTFNQPSRQIFRARRRLPAPGPLPSSRCRRAGRVLCRTAPLTLGRRQPETDDTPAAGASASRRAVPRCSQLRAPDERPPSWRRKRRGRS